jgi:hypothetical protein
VLRLRDIPSGNGGKFALALTEYAYGGNPPLAAMVHPAYACPCVPPGQELVVMVSASPGPSTVIFADAVVEP